MLLVHRLTLQFLPSSPLWSVSQLICSRASLSDTQNALVSRLARSAMLPNATASSLKDDLLRIISFTQAVQSVDTKGIEPLLSLAEERFAFFPTL